MAKTVKTVMTPGEIALLKILAEIGSTTETVFERFHVAFPTKSSAQVFSKVTKNLVSRGLISRDVTRDRLLLTEAGKEVIAHREQAESRNMKL